jgi:hypothetical protein
LRSAAAETNCSAPPMTLLTFSFTQSMVINFEQLLGGSG